MEELAELKVGVIVEIGALVVIAFWKTLASIF